MSVLVKIRGAYPNPVVKKLQRLIEILSVCASHPCTLLIIHLRIRVCVSERTPLLPYCFKAANLQENMIGENDLNLKDNLVTEYN